MPTTIKELKEFLNKFPEDTEVRVLKTEDGRGWESSTDVSWEDLKIGDWDTNVEFTDFTDVKRYPWVTNGKHDHLVGKKFLEFGNKG